MSDNIEYNYSVDNMLPTDVPKRLGKVTSITFNYVVESFDAGELYFTVTRWTDTLDEDGKPLVSIDLKDQDLDYINWKNKDSINYRYRDINPDELIKELWEEYYDDNYNVVDMLVVDNYTDVYDEHMEYEISNKLWDEYKEATNQE